MTADEHGGRNLDLDVEEVAQLLGLEPLPHEGGRYRRTYVDAHASVIYFLLGPTDASAMHRLRGPEVWHHYAGAAARLLLLHPDGRVEERLMGPDLRAGQRPQVVVPAGVWMGAVTTGSFSLFGMTMAPPYTQADFELGDHDELVTAYPDAAALLAAIAGRSAAS